MELKLEVWDSPNSAGVVIDAVRCNKLALDHGMPGRWRALGVLHEVAARAAQGREGARNDGGYSSGRPRLSQPAAGAPVTAKHQPMALYLVIQIGALLSR